MSGFLSSFVSNQLSEMLCVCINDSDPLPGETEQSEGKTPTTDDSPTSNIDNDIKSMKSDHSGSTEAVAITPSKDSTLAAADFYKEVTCPTHPTRLVSILCSRIFDI